MEHTTMNFRDVIFDHEKQAMTILHGTKGTYPYRDIKACKILNENAKYHGDGEPFAVTVSTSPLPVGLFSERAFYVGLKITLQDDTVLAIYTSETATRNNTDLHKKDTQEAENIKGVIDKILQGFQA